MVLDMVSRPGEILTDEEGVLDMVTDFVTCIDPVRRVID